jgi:hypothetical protein
MFWILTRLLRFSIKPGAVYVGVHLLKCVQLLRFESMESDEVPLTGDLLPSAPLDW